MEELKDLVKRGKRAEVADRVKVLLQEGHSPDSIMKKGMIPAMDEVGALFQEGEIYLPEMLTAARAMKAGLEIIKPRIVQSGIEPIGKVVMGTVRGDLHDIGKNLVIMALEGAGFEVIDLGVDVAPEAFVEAIREHKPAVVGMSALLSTTMIAMEGTVRAIKDAGVSDGVKIMVGGAPVSKEYAEKIGADFFGPDPAAGKDFAREVVSKEI